MRDIHLRLLRAYDSGLLDVQEPAQSILGSIYGHHRHVNAFFIARVLHSRRFLYLKNYRISQGRAQGSSSFSIEILSDF